MLSVRGKWVAGVSAGGVENYATNPQYRCLVTIFRISRIICVVGSKIMNFRLLVRNKRDPRSSCSLVISLTQALVRGMEAASIGFRVYKLSGDQREAVLGPAFINNAANLAAKSGTFINYREVDKGKKDKPKYPFIKHI